MNNRKLFKELEHIEKLPFNQQEKARTKLYMEVMCGELNDCKETTNYINGLISGVLNLLALIIILPLLLPVILIIMALGIKVK